MGCNQSLSEEELTEFFIKYKGIFKNKFIKPSQLAKTILGHKIYYKVLKYNKNDIIPITDKLFYLIYSGEARKGVTLKNNNDLYLLFKKNYPKIIKNNFLARNYCHQQKLILMIGQINWNILE